jgi:hypothetical protein
MSVSSRLNWNVTFCWNLDCDSCLELGWDFVRISLGVFFNGVALT